MASAFFQVFWRSFFPDSLTLYKLFMLTSKIYKGIYKTRSDIFQIRPLFHLTIDFSPVNSTLCWNVL